MAETATPEVLWAQRSPQSVEDENNFVFLTINVPDVSKDDMQLDLKPDCLTFTGTSGTLKRKYHVELPFYAEIDPKESKIHHTDKNIEIKIQKKESKKEYWPRLLKDSKKPHFVKTDFDKWVDEDEQNEAAEDDFSQFGGMGGMPGMGGDFGGIDFSKLGGAGGMPDLGAMGGEEGEEGEDSGDDDDDDMPALEGEGEGEGAAKKE
ncbi:HSP20-like chaperone [Metarhizium album ARSEF 1941]|uniref:HSP20-like chaperone n=1 Tax=Metarhizium album (strain ARSEF 1941) TaxID=1081103 RepID=A0A0B2X0J6_METAS|nr:HSP20-like chaperone [Metarhizium album ARSEF 1941]KHN99187.1 HSP20-like chaperone [Metarhizium album ARSEF 1941]